MTAPPRTSSDVVLRDGSTLQLCPPRAADAREIVALLGRLSERSRYDRFHGVVRPDSHLVTRWLEPDWEERGALAGRIDGRLVALASYERLRGRRTAEVAFAVEDAFQGRGVGTHLLEELAARAHAVGVEQFVATVLPTNRRMLGVFRDAGFDAVLEMCGGSVDVRFPIAPTERYRACVAARERLGVEQVRAPGGERSAEPARA